jgi:integrase
VRLLEGLRLRVKDLDFETGELIVGSGKGSKDRATTLPRVVVPALKEHMGEARLLHDRDVGEGFGRLLLNRDCQNGDPVPEAKGRRLLYA